MVKVDSINHNSYFTAYGTIKQKIIIILNLLLHEMQKAYSLKN